MAVTLPGSVLDRYRRFSLYNSPYAAHDDGSAVDLYPAGDVAPSPVAGEVIDVRTVRAPPKPYAAEDDHLILVDCEAPVEGHVARVLHVDPAVAPGDRVAVGDPLGDLVRAGFFAPWVDDHVHLGFRPPDANPYRASGSVRIVPDVSVEALPWDGTGTVVRTGDTYAVLDAPAHPAPGERFVGVGVDGPESAVLDGGLPHYDAGGLLGGADGPVPLAGATVGDADADAPSEGALGGATADGALDGETANGATADGALDGTTTEGACARTVEWRDVAVVANGREITGLSLFAARDAAFGAKLICPDAPFAVGERVEVTFERRSSDVDR